MKRNKVVTADVAVNMVRDGWVLGAEGFVGCCTADELYLALEKRFVETGRPKNVTLIHSSGPGDAATRGINRIAHPGMFKRVISGHYGLVPMIGKLALQNDFEAYNLPQGILTNFYRAVAGRKPGVFSKVGLGTFADPRLQGGKISEKAVEDIVEIVKIAGEEWLFMKSFPVNCVFIRGTTADTRGNITMEREALVVDALAMAMAARNSGGIVIAQVERIANPETLHPHNVIVPGIMVDYVVVSRPEYHMQNFGAQFRPELCGEIRVPITSIKALPLDKRKVMARRANLELRPYDVMNLGIGYPLAVAAVANEENILNYLTMTVEPGIIGGMPLGGDNFGCSVNPEAVISMPDQFDFYDGGGLDLTCLGFAQVDPNGNVNAHKFGTRVAGCGGFIDISQNSKRVLYMGTFTSGGLELAVADGQMKIVKEGKTKKFINNCEQITSSSQFSESQGQEVFYITERCVFKLIEGKLELIEIAPGIDLEKDILAQMEFRPVMRKIELMDKRLFLEPNVDIHSEFLVKELKSRTCYDEARNLLRLNFNGLEIDSQDDIDNIRKILVDLCSSIGKKVNTVVSYNAFKVSDQLFNEYMIMGKFMIETYYNKSARYNSNAEARTRFSDEFQSRQLPPNMFVTEEDALKYVLE
jgi:propionate CoA-transferase